MVQSCPAELDHLIEDPRFRTNELRVRNRTELIQMLEQKLSEKTLDEWNDAFDGAAFPYGAVNNLQRVFSDPQVQEHEHEASTSWECTTHLGHPVEATIVLSIIIDPFNYHAITGEAFKDGETGSA